jgi:enamine deaminase RidA (YjgF/YER057c/UK114 family)
MTEPYIEAVQPDGWMAAKGYANGMIAQGRTLHVGGQIGWEPSGMFAGTFVSTKFVDQFARALDNVLAVVGAAGGVPQHVVRMTVYVTDIPAYRGAVKELGAIWRERFGYHYPAMALVGVAELVHPEAVVEIEAIAALPNADGRGAP